MTRRTLPLLIAFPLAFLSRAGAQEEVSTASLLREMGDLSRLATWPSPAYRTIQYSSYDRRSTSPEEPGWFQNSDGFGREPIPGFEAVLREPDANGVGEYLLVDAKGPGAIVRGWSAGMEGVLRVHLDGNAEPVFEGTGYAFLARRSERFLERVGAPDLEARDAFVQQDADYWPMPFAKRLRVTWEGNLQQLHFYHLQVRFYEEGTRVRTFDPESDLGDLEEPLRETVRRLTEPSNAFGGETRELSLDLPPQGKLVHAIEAEEGGAAITEFVLRVRADDLEKALRGTVLRIRFDGASRPHVECPVGDFFGTGPGVHPYESLPITVRPDGQMVSRWVMPFAKSAEIEFENVTDESLAITGRVTRSSWTWNERSLHFRLKWRVDHDLLGGPGELVRDLPFLLARGRGRLVGLASILMNPTGIPTPSGSWWGEGDEKIFVDDLERAVAFGTGSEDYYNYSWSRPDLFAHPYCGQPLDSGPANSGYVSNHRWQVLDDLPFERAIEAYMELYPHTVTPGMSYARLAYHYARPGCRDDHRAPMPAELVVPELPPREPRAVRGARNATMHHLDELPREVSGGTAAVRRERLAIRSKILAWDATAGDRLSVTFPVQQEAWYAANCVLLHRPDGAVIRMHLDDRVLMTREDEERIALRSAFAPRDLSVEVRETRLEPGEHTLTFECVEAGFVGLDFLWLQRTREIPKKLVEGALEAEDLRIVAASPGVETESQGWNPPIFSSGAQLWVRANQKGAWVELEVPVPQPGRYRVSAYLTRSWDYGQLRFELAGRAAETTFEAFNTEERRVAVTGPVALGLVEAETSFPLRVVVAGSHAKSEPPHHYFGIDCLVLEPVR